MTEYVPREEVDKLRAQLEAAQEQAMPAAPSLEEQHRAFAERTKQLPWPAMTPGRGR